MNEDIEQNFEESEIDTYREDIAKYPYLPYQFKSVIGTNYKKAVYAISKYLIDTYHIKTIKGNKQEIFIFQEGIYISGEDVIRKTLREFLEEKANSRNIKEIIGSIKDYTPISRDEFKVSKNLINLNNGTFNIETLKLEAYNPENLFLTKIPVDFKPEADCPAIKKFLSDILDDEQILVIQECLGFGLYTEYFIKKAMICVGGGDTGKTTLLKVFHAFYGDKNVSGVSLQKISSDKFAVAHLYAKHINIYDDLSFKDIYDNGAFKIATGGGVITGEKKFGDQFQFKNYSKLIFACNKIPEAKDTNDDAYFNRWIIIPFNYPIELKDRDSQLIHKLTTPEELSGLLNFALEGLQRLLKNGSFSYDKNAEEIRSEMLTSGNPIAMFAFACLESSDTGWVSKDDMHKAYTNFTRSKNLPNTSIETLGKRLPKYASYIGSNKPLDPKTGKQITAWCNVKFKDNFFSTLPREENTKPEQGMLDKF